MSSVATAAIKSAIQPSGNADLAHELADSEGVTDTRARHRRQLRSVLYR
jgi:hypothetical protein